MAQVLSQSTEAMMATMGIPTETGQEGVADTDTNTAKAPTKVSPALYGAQNLFLWYQCPFVSTKTEGKIWCPVGPTMLVR